MAVERKYERDIDLLLAEEISVNPRFADWLRAQTSFANQGAKVQDVFVSKSTNLGESDLIILYTKRDGSRFALMIEDKVDAPLQPNQAERYRRRAEKDVSLGLYDDFSVVLCGPDAYLKSSGSAATFDLLLSFEDMAKALEELDASARSRYRADFLRSASRRRSNNWAREIDGETNAFWDAAYQLASRSFPILEMKRLKVTKDSTWINFRPKDMPTMPKRIYVSVKGDRGYMDLTFSNVTAHLFHDQIAHFLDPDMTVHQTSASSAIRIETPGFRPSDGIEIGLAKVRDAFVACERLILFFRNHRAALEAACGLEE